MITLERIGRIRRLSALPESPQGIAPGGAKHQVAIDLPNSGVGHPLVLDLTEAQAKTIGHCYGRPVTVTITFSGGD